eukprot:4459669-Pleurochrysis_carterae.AAC.1
MFPPPACRQASWLVALGVNSADAHLYADSLIGAGFANAKVCSLLRARMLLAPVSVVVNASSGERLRQGSCTRSPSHGSPLPPVHDVFVAPMPPKPTAPAFLCIQANPKLQHVLCLSARATAAALTWTRPLRRKLSAASSELTHLDTEGRGVAALTHRVAPHTRKPQRNGRASTLPACACVRSLCAGAAVGVAKQGAERRLTRGAEAQARSPRAPQARGGASPSRRQRTVFAGSEGIGKGPAACMLAERRSSPAASAA